MSKIKILLDAGHGAGTAHNRGYVGAKWKNEGDGNYNFSMLLKKELEALGITVGLTRPNIANNPGLSARGTMAKGYDLFLSLHTNAGGGTGVEIFEDVNARNTNLALSLCKIISQTLNITNRGVKYRYDGKSNYYGVLRANQAKAGMLIEHCFHDNKSDVTKYEDRAPLLAFNMAKTIAEHYGIKTSGTPGGTVTSSTEKKNSYFLIAYSKDTDFKLMDKIINGYFNKMNVQYLVTKSGEFDYKDYADYTIVNVGSSASAFSKIPKVQYLVKNMEDAEILISGQKNWQKLRIK